MLAAPADGKLLLASASQDKNVRIWVVAQQQEQQAAGQPGDSANGAAAAASLAASLTRYAPRPLIRAGQHTYAATLEAVLIGHEDWVHSVAWHPRVPAPDGSGGSSQPPCLLSASMDRTMMLWRPDQATGAHLATCCWSVLVLTLPQCTGCIATRMLLAGHLARQPASLTCLRCSKQRAHHHRCACCQSQRQSTTAGGRQAPCVPPSRLLAGRPPLVPALTAAHTSLSSHPSMKHLSLDR